jgi:TRAP-type C4-dicarboxylate transport system permease small subunit
MRRAVDALSVAGNWLAVLALLAILFVNGTEILLRRLTGSGLGGVVELSEVLLVCAVYFALAYAMQEGAHVSTSVVTGRLPVKVRASLRAVGFLLAAGVFLWITWETGQRGWTSFQRGETRMGLREVPIWPGRLAIPIGMALLTMQALYAAADQLRVLRGLSVVGVEATDNPPL